MNIYCVPGACMLDAGYMFKRESRQFLLSWHLQSAAAAATSLQLCLTLCDPINSSPPGSSVSGILQVRVLEWGAIAFSQEVLSGIKSGSPALPADSLLSERPERPL